MISIITLTSIVLHVLTRGGVHTCTYDWCEFDRTATAVLADLDLTGGEARREGHGGDGWGVGPGGGGAAPPELKKKD